MCEAFDEITPVAFEEFDPKNEHHLNWLLQAARERDDIFETKPQNDKPQIFKTPNANLD